MILIIIISLTISSIFSSQMDTIKFNPQNAWLKNNWWLSDGYKFPFLLKVPFSFAQNGWHFCKAVMLLTFLFPIASYLTTGILYNILADILIYTVYGIIFEIFYSDFKLMKGK